MSILRVLVNFAAGLAGGKVQLAVWASVLIGGGIYIANHQRVVKEKAMIEQRNHDLEQRAKDAEADHAAALAELADERSRLATLKDTHARERATLAGVRSQISAALSEGLADVAVKGQTLETSIRSIAADAIDLRSRDAIARARSADRELAGIRASN